MITLSPSLDTERGAIPRRDTAHPDSVKVAEVVRMIRSAHEGGASVISIPAVAHALGVKLR